MHSCLVPPQTTVPIPGIVVPQSSAGGAGGRVVEARGVWGEVRAPSVIVGFHRRSHNDGVEYPHIDGHSHANANTYGHDSRNPHSKSVPDRRAHSDVASNPDCNTSPHSHADFNPHSDISGGPRCAHLHAVCSHCPHAFAVVPGLCSSLELPCIVHGIALHLPNPHRGSSSRSRCR